MSGVDFKIPKMVVNNTIWNKVKQDCQAVAIDGDTLSNYASTMWKIIACQRACYWDRVDKIETPNNWWMEAEHGDKCHELVVDWFKRARLWRGDEVRGGNAKYNLSYRVDLLIEDCPGELDNVHPVEIKSINPKKWDYWGDDMLAAHYLQLQTYLHFNRPEPFSHGYLFYINRGTEEVRMIPILYDEKTGALIEEKVASLEAAVAEKKVPACEPDKRKCKFCEYAARCKEVGTGGI